MKGRSCSLRIPIKANVNIYEYSDFNLQIKVHFSISFDYVVCILVRQAHRDTGKGRVPSQQHLPKSLQKTGCLAVAGCLTVAMTNKWRAYVLHISHWCRDNTVTRTGICSPIWRCTASRSKYMNLLHCTKICIYCTTHSSARARVNYIFFPIKLIIHVAFY